MGVEEEIELIDRVFFRLLYAETDEAFQAALHKFVAPVVLKMASEHQEVRRKVMEVLQHINKRLRSRPLVTLPVMQLFDQYADPNNPIMVTNFSLVYVKMGLPRLSPVDQAQVIPKILELLPSKPYSQQEMFIMLILPSIKNIEFPSDAAKRKALFGLPDHPETRATLLKFFLEILKMPYSPFIPPPESPYLTNVPMCPPMYSEITYKKLQEIGSGAGFPKPEEIDSLKFGVTNYLIADVFPPQEIALHLLLAAAESRHRVATLGDDAMRRLSSEINWDELECVKNMVFLYMGTGNAINKPNAPGAKTKETVVLEAPLRVKIKLFVAMLKSKTAAQLFPQNLQIVCDALVGKETKVKLKMLGLRFVMRMAEFGQPHHLKAIGPTLVSTIWKVLQEEDAPDVRVLAYTTLGKLVSHVTSLVHDSLDLVAELFKRMPIESGASVQHTMQDAMQLITPAVAQAKQDVKEMLERLLFVNIDSSNDAVRRVTVQYAHHTFHTSWLPTRYLLLLACSDQLPDLQALARKLLHSKRRVEMPVAEHSFDLDLYPTFEEMSGYIEKRQEERISQKKTVSRGAMVMAFKPDTLQQMVKYLRTCLARSCGIKEPHVTDVAGWQEQAPIIATYSSQGKRDGEKPPSKQHKAEPEPASNSLVFYSELLVQSIQLNTTAANVYLLLELVATHPQLSERLMDKLDWFKGLTSHHDEQVQKYAAELMAIVAVEGEDNSVTSLLQQHIDAFKPSNMKVEQLTGSLYSMGSLISYKNRKLAGTQPSQLGDEWAKLTTSVVTLLEPLLQDIPKATVPLQVLQQINLSGPLCVSYGSADSPADEVNMFKIVRLLTEKVKSSKLDAKQRERVAIALGSMGVGDVDFPFRRVCMDGLFECSSTKELELHFTVGQALVMSAQGLDSVERRDRWRQSETDYINSHEVDGKHNDVKYLMSSILDKYICHVNPHIKQAACVWLLTAVKKCSKFEEVVSRSSQIQAAFMRLLSDNDEIIQDIASKGLGIVYDSCDQVQQKLLISSLVDTLMTGKSSEKKSGEVSGETKLFSEGSLGSTPEGQGMNTYRELCAIATDLNQPDLIYKFLHLASHQNMWNSRKGAAFGFSTIASQAGEQLAPYMSQIVPRLYRYTFDPNVKVQTAMRSIWNAVVTESKSTVDKYLKEILDDVINNLTNNQWRVRESCCLAVNDLIRGRQLDPVIDQLPTLWHVMLKLLDDIKESTRMAATTAAKTLSKVSIKICDVNYGKVGEKALSLILPVLLREGITSSVSEVRTLSLDTVVSMSKNAGAFLKPHIHTLVPIMLESLSGLEPQALNYLALRADADAQQKLDKARVAASKLSPMMDSINLCIQQVDETVLANLVPRLIELIKSSIGLGTKVGIASVLSSLCLHLGLQAMQPFAGKCMSALLTGLSDRNLTVRKHYSSCLANICKLAKDSSVEKLIHKLNTWFMEKQDDTKGETSGLVLKSMADLCPDTINKHKTQVLPLVFLAMHTPSTSSTGGSSPSTSTAGNIWVEIWNEVTIGTDSAVRLYIEEFIAITGTALQSNSWQMKAQAAAAMATIAKSAGSNMNTEHLSKLVAALLSGLSGRTWEGKEVLLSALSDVVRTCSSSMTSSIINTDEIVKVCMREASKESIKYKVPAIICLAVVLESLKKDRYTDFYGIIVPYLNMDKHEDEEVSGQLLIKLREKGFEAIGKAWPLVDCKRTHDECIVDTSRLLLARLAHVTWREQLSIWNSFITIIDRTKLKEVNSPDGSPWSLDAFTEELIEAALTSARESKYSAIRETACKCIRQLLLSVKVTHDMPSARLRSKILAYVKECGSADVSLDVKNVCEELQQLLS